MDINKEVKQELDALVEIGVNVPEGAFQAAAGDLSEYQNMGISELADLLIMLSV